MPTVLIDDTATNKKPLLIIAGIIIAVIIVCLIYKNVTK